MTMLHSYEVIFHVFTTNQELVSTLASYSAMHTQRQISIMSSTHLCD